MNANVKLLVTLSGSSLAATFGEFGVSWVVCKDYIVFVLEKRNLSGNGKKAKTLWGCIVLAVFMDNLDGKE